jgi:hypothetical protein
VVEDSGGSRMDGGWIKLLRKFTRWEWYDDPPTKVVFLHLLLTANYQDGGWRGEVVHRGQVIAGRRTLSQQLGLSEKQVRRAIGNLESTGEINVRRASNYSVITICNYDKYQTEFLDEGRERANKGPAIGPEKGQHEGQQGASDSCDVSDCDCASFYKKDKEPETTEGQQEGRKRASDRATSKEVEEVKNNNPPISPQGDDDKKASKKKSKEKKAIEYTEPFLRFWDAYPKKVGKGAAAKSWNDKIEKPDQTVHQILDALEWQKRSHDWTRDEGRYIPYPSTYLNQRRWEDEPPEVSKVDTGEKLPAWMKELYGETTGK